MAQQNLCDFSGPQRCFTPSGENRAGVKTAYHGGLKSFDTQTNAAQSIVGQRLTDAFGNQISSSGVWKGRFAYGGPYGYQEDPDTGLRLLGHRYYDSSTGRFLTRDPLSAGRNWYNYCHNSPVDNVDPLGLDKIVIVKGDYGNDEAIFNDIVGDIRKKHSNDEIVVVDNADDAYKELVDADQLIWVGHYDPIMEGEWHPTYADMLAQDGNTISPEEISKRRRGKRLKKILLIGCNTLTNPANAAAWGRLCDGNLYGTKSVLDIRKYAWGWSAYPNSKLEKFDPKWRPSKTWWGGRKKGKGVGIGGGQG